MMKKKKNLSLFTVCAPSAENDHCCSRFQAAVRGQHAVFALLFDFIYVQLLAAVSSRCQPSMMPTMCITWCRFRHGRPNPAAAAEARGKCLLCHSLCLPAACSAACSRLAAPRLCILLRFTVIFLLPALLLAIVFPRCTSSVCVCLCLCLSSAFSSWWYEIFIISQNRIHNSCGHISWRGAQYSY